MAGKGAPPRDRSAAEIGRVPPKPRHGCRGGRVSEEQFSPTPPPLPPPLLSPLPTFNSRFKADGGRYWKNMQSP